MITAIVHTFNEEKNIERCLSSLSGWVDETIVVDMGSTDRTTEIVQNSGAKLYQFHYTGFVEPARNFGISKAKGSWIMILDADEEIPRTLSTYLLKAKKEALYEYFRIPRKNIIFAKWIAHAGWWPDYQVRFFRKGSVVWTDKIHGVPLTRGVGKDVEVREDLSITHYHYQSIEQFIDRLNRYTSITAKELFLSDTRFSLKALINAAAAEFTSRFFAKEGYKDGLHGFALSLLQSFYETAVYLKLWELENFRQEKVSLKETEKLLLSNHHKIQYWLANEILKKPRHPLDNFLYRLKRKFYSHG